MMGEMVMALIIKSPDFSHFYIYYFFATEYEKAQKNHTFF
jgi:hypothetical protein